MASGATAGQSVKYGQIRVCRILYQRIVRVRNALIILIYKARDAAG